MKMAQNRVHVRALVLAVVSSHGVVVVVVVHVDWVTLCL
jgi:hypothetical protein